jgi:hypothetical protein
MPRHSWLRSTATGNGRGWILGIGRGIMTFATERHWDTLVKMLDTET